MVGGHPPADPWSGLQDPYDQSGAGQLVSRGQPREPGSDDDDVRVICGTEHVILPG
ncbi:hypothetical protein GCM10010249_39430 [Streptomyces roseolilacinus]|uniref:Uncharacterized protein n=1 Tax=Streptomyces roseolilacinus TaxID=66904 RepID=A0A918B5K1_9ACTN|nr:hypothetical protein GCM10010249_39430 [Streptomyces roseolilacinus]